MAAPKSITHFYTKIKPSNIVSNKIQISHNETISPNTYLQIIPVIVSNGSKSIRTNALLDTGSDSTFVTSDISQKLNLQGKTQQISLCNVLSNKDTFNSKLVDFEISSMTSPTSEKNHGSLIR